MLKQFKIGSVRLGLYTQFSRSVNKILLNPNSGTRMISKSSTSTLSSKSSSKSNSVSEIHIPASSKQIHLRSLQRSIKKNCFPWVKNLERKQTLTPFYLIFKEDLNKYNVESFMEQSSNLQDFLSYLASSINGNEKNSVPHKYKSKFKSLEGVKNAESAFVLIIHTILKARYPEYNNETVNKVLEQFRKDLKPQELFISKETIEMSAFGDDTQKILNNNDVLLAFQILKLRLNESKGWIQNNESRDDNVISWIMSLFQPSISKSLAHLTKSRHMPDVIVYDLLLRKPECEAEYKCLFEIYKAYSTSLNLIDQEQLYYSKQLESTFNRNLVIPPMFNNLFEYALRYKLDHLPTLIDLYLKDNQILANQSFVQISELIWKLSYDHSGEHINKPSRYYNIAQSKLIKVVNHMVENMKGLEVDVTTMLGVSNLSFYRNFRKSFTMFKAAKTQFNHWHLKTFKVEGFETVSLSPSKYENKKSEYKSLSIKEDYNIKFLCNSILLLAVNDSNYSMVSQDLRNIFFKVDLNILIKYPEIWLFVLIKLNYHSMLKANMIEDLLQEYYMHSEKYRINNPIVLDILINNTNKLSTLLTMLSILTPAKLDDNNLAHMISKLYKLAKSPHEDENPLKIARELYNKAPNESTRVNSAYLLGESLYTPKNTFERYSSLGGHFKITPLTLSSLFVSTLRLRELGEYEYTKWNNLEPLEFAMQEFDKHVSRAYGDTKDGKIYPNDNLLAIYIDCLQEFHKKDEIYKLLDRLVDLKYPLGLGLFSRYLNTLTSWDKAELLRCLDLYRDRFEEFRNCKSEYELKSLKAKTPGIKARGNFENFVEKLEFNWDIVRKWQWPDKKN